MTATSVPSMASQRIVSTPLGYLPWAIWVMPTVLVATIRFSSSARLPATFANATAPTPPGMLVTFTGSSTRPSSCSSLPTERQVKSQPPPGSEGAMHSTLPWGSKAMAFPAPTVRAATAISVSGVLVDMEDLLVLLSRRPAAKGACRRLSSALQFCKAELSSSGWKARGRLAARQRRASQLRPKFETGPCPGGVHRLWPRIAWRPWSAP